MTKHSLKYRKKLLRIIANYTSRLEALYDKFIDRLLLMGYAEDALEQDVLFNFDNIPEATGELNTILSDYVTDQLLCYENGIASGVALSYEANSAALSGFSVLSDVAINAARETAAATFIRERLLSPLGLNLSQMVWNYATQAKSEFEVAVTDVIADGLKKGTSAETLGRKVREYLNNPDMMYRRYHEKVIVNGEKKDIVTWRRRVVDENGNVHFVKEPLEKVGQGTYRSARKNGLRLMRTEINGAYHRANYERWQKEPFVIGIRIFLSPEHPRYDICDELEGNYPKDFLWAGWHPQCMCASAPITIEGEERREFYRRLTAGEDMSEYLSPNAITDVPEKYKQYVREHVDEIVDAGMRGKLAWHFCDNRKYWENIQLNPEEEGVIEKGAVSEDANIAEARKKFANYDENWEKAYFNDKNGGFNVYHREHLFAKTKGKEARYTGGEAEKVVGKILADTHAKQVEFLPEKGFDEKKADLFFDSATWDVKYIPTANVETIRKYIRNGAKAENIIFYWDDENRLDDLQRAVERTKGALRAKGKQDTLPNIFYIDNNTMIPL